MITKLQLTNYRSYGDHQFELHPISTIVVGPNATGKTNLLEALYVLSNTKSFRARDQELVAHGHDYFRVEATTPQAVIGLGYKSTPPTTKQVDYDRVKRPLVRHIGAIPSVLFEPEDLQMPAGSPSLRRRYLDGILSQVDPNYLQALRQYQKILKQRNSLLERFDMSAVKAQIFAWDVTLTTNAVTIVEARQRLLAELNERASYFYRAISHQPIALTFSYLPSVATSSDYGQAFIDGLAQNLPRDLAAGFTTIGPHREDFMINFGGTPIAAVASRGEVRSTVLALKLAELERLSAKGQTPLLLLDDVFSELDETRRRFLLTHIDQYQSIITTTDADVVRSIDLDHAIILTSQMERYAAN